MDTASDEALSPVADQESNHGKTKLRRGKVEKLLKGSLLSLGVRGKRIKGVVNILPKNIFIRRLKMSKNLTKHGGIFSMYTHQVPPSKFRFFSTIRTLKNCTVRINQLTQSKTKECVVISCKILPAKTKKKKSTKRRISVQSWIFA